MPPTNHLVAFVKAPRLGQVKTRLAADIGAVEAWTFYRRTMQTVLGRLEGGGRWRRWLAITPDLAAGMGRVWPRGWECIAQGNGDLGARMGRVIRSLPAGPVVIIGTDVPSLGSHHVARAFRTLGNHDVVLGPSADGGYWLVGARRRPRIPNIFQKVRWSSQFALADTLANLCSLRVAQLEVLEDIDDGADYERWRRRIQE